jgi:hypothetical protein
MAAFTKQSLRRSGYALLAAGYVVAASAATKVDPSANLAGTDIRTSQIITGNEVVNLPNPSAPAYQPELWPASNAPTVRDRDARHCYTYGVNASGFVTPGDSVEPEIREQILPSKGNLFGAGLNDFNKNVRAIIAGAALDGLDFIGQEPRIKPGTYLIAYYQTDPKSVCKKDGCVADYHFVRQNSDGGWSHKLGDLAVSRLDSNGLEITDPRTAHFELSGRPYRFVGFFQVPEGGLKPDDRLRPGTGLNGLIPTNGQITPRLGQSLVARFTDNNSSMHLEDFYVRQNEEGQWVRIAQDGRTTTRDTGGRAINNPATAQFIGYKFSGFYFAPNGETGLFQPPANSSNNSLLTKPAAPAALLPR